jgi:hypothetical protein
VTLHLTPAEFDRLAARQGLKVQPGSDTLTRTLVPTQKRHRDYEAELLLLLKHEGLPEPTPQHKFHQVRRWRLDLAWPSEKLAVEVHGATWVQGRHTRGAGFRNDRQKVDEAITMGWRVLEVTPDMIDSGEAVRLVTACLGAGA